jgi:CheY-like chemotaxis protein
MTRYRALIVDDSRSARHSLAKLLEAHDLGVEFASSGEEGLEFLKHHLVDVIFMDHSMPGMDGLEAVQAIKSNPRTAIIPVMMYTATEGEVYVGQARAFGAVGVLPKQVQPGQLFDMLLKLGLVSDRRAAAEPPTASAPRLADTPRRRFADLIDDVDREYEQRALGASVQVLLQQLRADLQNSQRGFARQVAAEILTEQNTPLPTPPPRRTGVRLLQAAALLMAAGLVLLGGAYQALQSEHTVALNAIASQQTDAREDRAEPADLQNLLAEMQAAQEDARTLKAAAAEALSWALHQNASVAAGEPPFNAVMADRLLELADYLTALDFRGRVVVTAHLGRFCLVGDDYGGWEPAPADLPAGACEILGHPLDGAFPSALQTVEFADALRRAEIRAADWSVELRTTVANAGASHWPAALRQRAGELNAEAALVNRVEIGLVPSFEDQPLLSDSAHFRPAFSPM